jgi:hypothetical protein
VQEGLNQQNIPYIPITNLQDTTSTRFIFTSPDLEPDPSRSIISMDHQSTMRYLSLNGLILGTLKAGAQVHHSRSLFNFCMRLMQFFSPLKKPHWNACFRSGWTDWRNVVGQLVIQ